LYFKNSGEATSISIYDLSGKLMLSQSLTSDMNSIDATVLKQGVYVAKIFNNNSVNIFKVVKK
jgi:hypothetical protein